MPSDSFNPSANPEGIKAPSAQSLDDIAYVFFSGGERSPDVYTADNTPYSGRFNLTSDQLAAQGFVRATIADYGDAGSPPVPGGQLIYMINPDHVSTLIDLPLSHDEKSIFCIVCFKGDAPAISSVHLSPDALDEDAHTLRERDKPPSYADTVRQVLTETGQQADAPMLGNPFN